jgi:hypothetical protein
MGRFESDQKSAGSQDLAFRAQQSKLRIQGSKNGIQESGVGDTDYERKFRCRDAIA